MVREEIFRQAEDSLHETKAAVTILPVRGTMPIINTTPAQPTPQTSEQLLIGRIQRHKQTLNNVFKQNMTTFEQISEFIWKNRQYTPQQVLDGYGTDAADLFKLSAAFNAMIEAYTGEPLSVVPEGYSYTINEDGTVTVTAPTAPEEINNEGE